MLSSDYNIFMSDNIVRHIYVVETYKYVVEQICCIRHICCITKYVVDHNMSFNILCRLTEYVV